MGFSFKSLAKTAQSALNANPAGAASVLKLAERYGPMVATANPYAAVAITAAGALQKRAQSGDPRALAKIAAIQAGARRGDPRAQSSANLLRAANAVRARTFAPAPPPSAEDDMPPPAPQDDEGEAPYDDAEAYE